MKTPIPEMLRGKLKISRTRPGDMIIMIASRATMIFLIAGLWACGGNGSDNNDDAATEHTVTSTAGANGGIAPASTAVNAGDITSFTVTANSGYQIDSVSGCSGSLSGNTYTTGAVNADCTVSASFAEETSVTVYTVNATADNNGSIDPASNTVNAGDTTSFTITANSGYQIDSVSGCSGSLSGNTYTTGAVNTDCTVTANFVLLSVGISYTVNATAGANGSINPASTIVDEGDTATLTVAADSGYQIDSISGCSGSLTGNTYTTGAVNADCTVTASFVLLSVGISFTVNATAGANGSINPASTIVNEGDTATLTVAADSGYQIDSVSGCSGSLSGNTYTTGAVNADCTVNATFLLTTPPVVSTSPLNDTGFTDCTTLTDYDSTCNDAGAGTDQFSAQDAEHGRDVTHNDDSDGHAGFSFTKLDDNGAPLADQAAIYALNPWVCVKDEVTDMTWEVKTDSGNLHDKDWRYTWYDNSGKYFGSDAGVPASDESIKSCLTNQRCDSEKFIEDVNAAALCGYTDWRLPKRGELLSLMDFRADYNPPVAGWKTAFIDNRYFPNTKLEYNYWTDSRSGFGDEKRVIAFEGEPSTSATPIEKLSVRLVRGGN